MQTDELLTYEQALQKMNQGYVVKYMGSIDCPSNIQTEFAMFRGVIFKKKDGVWMNPGCTVYDEQFRYSLTGETIDRTNWPSYGYLSIDIEQTPKSKKNDDLAFDITLKSVPYECMLLLEQMSYFYAEGQHIVRDKQKWGIAPRLEEDKAKFLELLSQAIIKTEQNIR
jgi:hypothetical protein